MPRMHCSTAGCAQSNLTSPPSKHDSDLASRRSRAYGEGTLLQPRLQFVFF